MINYVIRNTRKWIPQFKPNTSYRKMFNKAIDNLELNKLEERTVLLSVIQDDKRRKAGF
jgi:hypothetical protein